MDSRMIDWQKYAAGSETSCQIAIFGWFAENRDKYPETKYMFHIPNGGTRLKREAARFKAAGVKPGVPDLCLPIVRKPYNGLWVELKMIGNRISKEQNDWLIRLNSEGYYARVCYGFEDTKKTIIDYLESTW